MEKIKISKEQENELRNYMKEFLVNPTIDLIIKRNFETEKSAVEQADEFTHDLLRQKKRIFNNDIIKMQELYHQAIAEAKAGKE